MSGTITVTIITAIATILTTVVTVWGTNRHTLTVLDKKSEISDMQLDAKLEKHQAVTDTKIEELTREVRKHNNFAERVPVLEEQIREANSKIADLAKKG